MTGRYIAYVLDPVTAKFFAQAIPDLTLETIKEVIKVDAIDSLAFDPSHTLYFDDEGLKCGITHYMTIEGQPDPVVGVVVLIANADTGSRRPLMSIIEAASAFSLYRPVMDPIVTATRDTHRDMTVFVSAIEGFTTRTERFAIHVDSKSGG